MTVGVANSRAAGKRRKRWVFAALGAAVLAAMALDTKVVQVGSADDVRQQAFAPDAYGAEQFPRIQAFVEGKAVDAATFGAEMTADKDAAAKNYGTPATTGSIIPVKITGVAGEVRAGVYNLTVQGLPDGVTVRVQTGPAINGTDLRDVPGDIAIGQFKNQIEYQNAGSGINRAMKVAVLENISGTDLTGRTLEIVGAFRLVNPKNWLITPVKMVVK